jgi:hypothetical protein
MKGLVNYHIEEDEENYKIIIDADGIKGNNITKYSLEEKEIELHDPRDGRAELKFSKSGLQFVTYPTAVKKFDSVIDESTKEVYEQELAELLKSNLENVAEVVVFDHTIRSDFSSSRPSCVSRAWRLHSYQCCSKSQGCPGRQGRGVAGRWGALRDC